MTRPFSIYKKKKKPGEKDFRLTDIDPKFVSLVTAGANRQRKFQVIKTDVEMEVPAADASSEEKRAAQEARSSQYGIEALDTNANLSYPAGNPTTEVLYADPANLKYPLGLDSNEPDVGRIRNAISRFKGNHGEYSKDSSKEVVYERIVRAALAAGIEVSYDENDPIDALLPSELKQRLMELENEKGDEDDQGSSAKGEAKADLASWLEEAGAKVDSILIDATLSSALDGCTRQKNIDPNEDLALQIGDRDVPPEQVKVEARVKELEEANQTLRDENEQLHEEVAALQGKIAKLDRTITAQKAKTVRLRKGAVGGASTLMAGEVGKRTASKQKRTGEASERAWKSGGDLALAVAKESD